jgi:hypothetical protein
MRVGRRCPGTLAAAVIATALIASVARAAGVTAEQLISIAEQQLGMSCTLAAPSLESCATASTAPDQWTADIEPASGPVTRLTTAATQAVAPLDQRAVSMMEALHFPTCADRVAIEAFITKVGSLVDSGALGPETIGSCTMTGDLVAAPRSYVYTVTASVIPSPTPTPTPSRTPSANPSPALQVTPRTLPSGSPSPSGMPSQSRSATSSPTVTPSQTPSASPATPSTSATPGGDVAGAEGTPAPSGGGTGARIAGRGFAASVAAPSEVRLDAASLGASALLAVILLLVMAFPGELFNSTIESNYDEIAGWLRRLRIRGPSVVWRGPFGMALFIGLGALVYSLLDPEFGSDPASAASYVGLLLGLVVVLVSFELPGLLMHRRRTGELGRLRALPWTLVAGGACVLVSRLAGFEPGYLYGVLLGVVFRQPQPDEDEGRQAAAGALWTLVVALAAWLALGWLRANVTDVGFVRVAGETALAAVVVAGLEAVAFGMMPFRFLSGAAVRQWSGVAWAALFVAGAFAFVQVLIGPQSGYLADLAPSGLVAALAVFAAFALLSFATWGYFRFRPARTPGSAIGLADE